MLPECLVLPVLLLSSKQSSGLYAVILDECHEAIHLDNEKHMDVFQGLVADNVWCVTGENACHRPDQEGPK
jgi:hypothetical protein